MPPRPILNPAAVAALSALLGLSACDDAPQIRVYDAPVAARPDVDAITQAAGLRRGDFAAPVPAAGPADGSVTRMTWALPDGWRATGEANAFRVDTLITPSGAEVAVSRVPGPPGNMTANVNRWRGQLGLAELEPKAVMPLVRQSDNPDAVGYVTELRNPETDQAMTVAWFEFDRVSWFFKLTGDTAAVEAATPDFLALTDGAERVRPGSPAPAMAPERHAHHEHADPHAALHAGSEEAGEFDTGEVAGLRPAGWAQAPAKPPRVASFHTAGHADVSVTFFPGDVGGDLANINRWRGQLGLPPLDDLAQQDSFGFPPANPVLRIYNLRGGGQGILAAIIPDSRGRWFIKLQGAAAEADAQRENLMAFIGALRLPLSAPEAADAPGAAPSAESIPLH